MTNIIAIAMAAVLAVESQNGADGRRRTCSVKSPSGAKRMVCPAAPVRRGGPSPQRLGSEEIGGEQ